jgi:hypothetical protein
VKGTYKGSSAHTLEVSVTIGDDTSVKEQEELAPVFTYTVHADTTTETNSYRKFVEMQQQQ